MGLAELLSNSTSTGRLTMCRRLILAAVILGSSTGPIQQAAAHEGGEIEEIIVRGRWDRPNGLTVSASQGYVSQADVNHGLVCVGRTYSKLCPG